jgi:hypothetical protein
MYPETILNNISIQQKDQDKQRLVDTVLQGMRENKINIKKWQVQEISEFLKHVAIFAPKDLRTFYNYIELGFQTSYYKVTYKNFNAISDIFFTFVEFGLLNGKSRTKFYYSYLVGIKDVLYPGRRNEEESVVAGKEHRIDNLHIIKVVWSLLLTEDPQEFTPIALKLLTDLAAFDRPEKPLTEQELLMLYQINVFI